MYVTYFDEVKDDPAQGQDAYWVGGICVKMDHIAGLEEQTNKIAQEWFKSQELTEATEFHGKALCFGKYPCKNWTPERRLQILLSLVDIIAQTNVIRRVYAKMNVPKLYAPEKAAEYAFAHFCERVQMLVGDVKTLLIGGGIKIPSIVDCMCTSRNSHHSRMIQLADIYLFAATHRHSSRKGEADILATSGASR